MLFIKRDIRRMSRRLEEIAQSDTNAHLTTATSDRDVAALAMSINVMLERNRRDLFEKNRAEAALRRAVTNISHDLRTPLTSALGYLQMLESPDLDGETRARYLDTVKGRLEVLSALMNNLFELARVMEGNITFDMQKSNVCNTLRDALSDVYADLESKGFIVDADIPDAPHMCVYDKDALRRVLQNLLKNVCVHGREYLRIRVFDEENELSPLQDSAVSPKATPSALPSRRGAAPNRKVIEIANKAEGLSELDAERIFERFYTADASRTSKNTGLGLAIAKELTERMGGQLSARVAGDMLVIRVMLSI